MITLFDVTVVKYPEIFLRGLKIRTAMNQTANDCPALWGKFCQIMTDGGFEDMPAGFYGISIMLDDSAFEYWAAAQFEQKDNIPVEFAHVQIPSGWYAKTTVPNIDLLGEVYTFLSGEWLKMNPDYGLNMDAPCFEWYPPDWRIEDTFDIFMPVLKRY